jgi:hypothetical protein
MQNKNISEYKFLSDFEIGLDLAEHDLDEVEGQFVQLLNLNNLDEQIRNNPSLTEALEIGIEEAVADAYESDNDSNHCHLFLQRILYRINRMKLFWYDNLSNYDNECSPYLSGIRNRIEFAWQEWEREQLQANGLKEENVENGLKKRAEADLEPKPTETDNYFKNNMTEKGYRCLLAIASLDGLVEASQLSRMISGVGNEVQSMLTRLLIEEYGAGRLQRKHSTYFSEMLLELGMETEPEAYFYMVPWQVLANINHSFYLCDRNRHFLRYIGGLLYTETSVPFAFNNYKVCTERLNLSEKAQGYWDLHIKVDKMHGQWMLNDVAIPLIENYKDFAWEMLLGYDQQKFISSRAGEATVHEVREADKG